MNTHDKIKLPKLPEPVYSRWVDGVPAITLAEHAAILGQYARTAIEADRQQANIRSCRSVEQLKEALLNRSQRFIASHSEVSNLIEFYEADRKTTERQLTAYRGLVNSLEARLAHLRAQHDELKKSTNPELLASERAANAMLTEELEANRQERNEPVGYFYQWELDRSISTYPNGFPDAVPVYTAPQSQQIPEAFKAVPVEPEACEPVKGAIERLAINRYRPVPAGVFSYKVVAGDGSRSLFSGTKDECKIVAAKLTEAFLDGVHVAQQPAEPYRKALHDLILDLEMRSNLKRGDDKGVVDCGNGVYRQALMALGELK